MFKSRYSDRLINLSLIVISILGVVMIGSSSVGKSGEYGGSYAIVNMVKHIGFIIGGLIVMFLVKKWFKPSLLNRRILNVGLLAIIGTMLICLCWEPTNGAQAWIYIGPFSLQPSEFAKIFLVCYLAFYFVDVPHAMQISPNLSYENRVAMKKRKRMECLIKPLAVSIGVFLVCVVIQNDLGTGLIIAGIVVVCFFSATDRYYKMYQRQIFAALCIAVVVIAIAFPILMNVLQDYQKARFTAWLDPFSDPLDTSYHQLNALIAFAKNGLLGLGLGNSTQKFGYIPEANTDYIAAITFEELGIFGLFLIIVPYVTIIVRLFKYAFMMKDGKAKIILCGIASYFFFHLFFNLGGVSGLIPITGVPLLCISSGGSSTISAYLAIGIAQSYIWRFNKEKAAQQIPL